MFADSFHYVEIIEYLLRLQSAIVVQIRFTSLNSFGTGSRNINEVWDEDTVS